MSRSKNFFHAVWSGYALTVATSVLNLVTIPIALFALGKAEFGLWNAVLQVTTVAAVLDLGVGPSLSRFIIDFKDDHANPLYADFLKSVFFFGLIQTVLFAAFMTALIPYLPDLMGIEPEQRKLFANLMYWQLVPMAFGFLLRPLPLLLYAHQHIAKVNGCSLIATLASSGILIFCLKINFGIYAYIVSAWTAFLVMNIAVVFYVFKLRLIPSLSNARISWKAVKPLAAFSSNILLIGLGGKLVAFAPALLVTRQLGVSALADWTIGTRLITFVAQLVDRIHGSAEPMFWEMFKRHETARLRQRWIELTLLAGSIAALLGGGMVAINPTFIQLWTRVSWQTNIDLFLAGWAVLVAMVTCLNMAAGITKRLGIMKIVYVFEGAALMAIAYLPIIHLKFYWQIALILIFAASLSRLPYGLFRTCRDLEISMPLLLKTLMRIFGVTLLLLMVAWLLRTLTATCGLVSQLIIAGTIYTLIGIFAVYFISLPAEICERIRGILRRGFLR